MAYSIVSKSVVFGNKHRIQASGENADESAFSLYYFNEEAPDENGWYADAQEEIDLDNWVFDEFGTHILYFDGNVTISDAEGMNVTVTDTEADAIVYEGTVAFDSGRAVLELHLIPKAGP